MFHLVEALDELQTITDCDIRSFMEEHCLTQADLPELGSPPTVSQLLSGKRKLSVRQVKALAQRFGVTVERFWGQARARIHSDTRL